MKKIIKSALVLIVLCYCKNNIYAQVDISEYNALQWRMVGPHRGGRTVGATGVPSQPNVFYIGVNNGGIWKTTDFGRTWSPIFDSEPTGSIGDIVVSPSHPDVIYVGTGEGLQRPDLSVGDGIYKSSDGGKTWTNTGLKDAQQIGGMAIDPQNPDRVFVAALGHPYGPNAERGVYRTLDGGKSWERVLFMDENTGAAQVAIDPSNPNVIYADLWAARQGPWENGAWEGAGSGLFKSTDGGATWRQLTKGLPTTKEGLGRIGFTIAPANADRIYATVDAQSASGIYRSDDAGESWYKVQTDARLFGRGSDFAEIKADPLNADIVYTANVVTWKSFDGGRNWKDFRGAPGGDDYHRIWINPNNPQIMLIASDQGAIVTVNGGQTFSSWYNQPTAQFYHVSTDNAFPYNVYGGQQESGSVGIASRGNDGQITFREWHPVGAEEYGYVVADPKDPNIVYGGKLTKYDKRTGQTQNIAPEIIRSGKYRFLRTAPVVFSPVDNKTLFYAGNVLFKTRDGGRNWQLVSPDLSREAWDIPPSVGVYNTPALKNMPRRGVIYTVAPSPLDSNLIWCGTDDGLIYVTTNGGRKWNDVTPPQITSWSKVSIIDAGHHASGTAYAAVNRFRLDDLRPHIYKTHNGGRNWEEIVNGLGSDPVNVVREDPYQKGLLFAGTERAVYVSFDDGANWQPLRLNMPATSIRDLIVKDNDLVVATHGRSFWILDDIAPLRAIAQGRLKKDETFLVKPSLAYRVRWNTNTDTPLPQEEPAGENPPDGAIFYYNVAPSQAHKEVSLEIYDGKGALVRRFTNMDTLYKVPPVNIPLYWIRPQEKLSAETGLHRFVWDLHYTPLNTAPEYPIAAVYRNTAPQPTAPWVMPGTYTVILTCNGQRFRQQVQVAMDPRVKTPEKDLQLQYRLSASCYNARRKLLERLSVPVTGSSQTQEFRELDNSLAALFNSLQDSDMPPTTQMVKAVEETLNRVGRLVK